ncbi:glycosyl hydrolase [Streptomyces sp. NPDC049954]|uniref:glycoside hydrolase 5 family protein n=1 Tax=Streptomyces sp. NPDC049954 TaxID=3155779 RepID=UPI0034305E13
MLNNTHRVGPRFGVNYVPSRNWWYCWNDWDADSVLADLQAVSALGMDHIRIQLLWPVFQPNPAMVSPSALDRLSELLDLADRPDTGLDVSVSVLDGWLSGFAFKPAWLKGRNMIGDEDVVRAELYLLDALAAAVGAHPRFLGFDLGNEIAVLNDDVAPAVGDRWAARLLNHCEHIAPGRFHVNGVDHLPWLEGQTFSQRGVVTSGSASVFHSYPYWTGVLERHGPDGTGTRHLGEFMAELAEAYAEQPGRPKWLQEFGASPAERAPETIPDWAETFIRATLSSAGVWGCTWWGSHDIDRRFAGFDEYEYGLGLLTVDNQVKPAGRRIAELVATFRNSPPQPVPRPTALVVEDFGKAGLEVAEDFFALIDEGIRPALVTADRAADASYLASRGITELRRRPEPDRSSRRQTGSDSR